MNNILLYAICVLIWGSTWFAITLQLGKVPPAVSVFYRFGLAAVISFIFCASKKKNLRFSFQDHLWFFLQGLCLFCVNYIFTYYAEANVSSGVVAVAFTLLIYFNMIGMRIFYQQKMESRVLISGLIGALGVGCIFFEQIAGVSARTSSAKGILFAIVATFVASVGNIVSIRVRRQKLPVLETNSWSMLYGAVMTGLIAAIAGLKFDFVFTPTYVTSLFYLAAFGSVIAFAAYITLIGTIGADRAAYTGVLTPVIALAISSTFEKFQWHLLTFVGVALSIFGNYLILKPKKSV